MGAVDFGGEHILDRGGLFGQDRRIINHPCGMNDAVDGAEPGDGGGNRGLHVLQIADIGGDGQDVANAFKPLHRPDAQGHRISGRAAFAFCGPGVAGW